MQRSPKCQECDNDSIAIWIEPGAADRRYLCVECTCRYVRAALPRGYLLGINAMDRETALAIPPEPAKVEPEPPAKIEGPAKVEPEPPETIDCPKCGLPINVGAPHLECIDPLLPFGNVP